MLIEHKQIKEFMRTINNQVGTDEDFLKAFPGKTPLRTLPTLNDSNCDFVDSYGGSDDTGTGTWSNPYKTLQYAFDNGTHYNIFLFTTDQPGTGNIKHKAVLHDAEESFWFRPVNIYVGLVYPGTGAVSTGDWATIEYDPDKNINRVLNNTLAFRHPDFHYLIEANGHDDISTKPNEINVLFGFYNSTGEGNSPIKYYGFYEHEDLLPNGFTAFRYLTGIIEFNNKIYISSSDETYYNVKGIWKNSNDARTAYDRIYSTRACHGLFTLGGILYTITTDSSGGIYRMQTGETFTRIDGTVYDSSPGIVKVVVNDENTKAYLHIYRHTGDKTSIHEFNGTTTNELDGYLYASLRTRNIFKVKNELYAIVTNTSPPFNGFIYKLNKTTNKMEYFLTITNQHSMSGEFDLWSLKTNIWDENIYFSYYDGTNHHSYRFNEYGLTKTASNSQFHTPYKMWHGKSYLGLVYGDVKIQGCILDGKGLANHCMEKGWLVKYCRMKGFNSYVHMDMRASFSNCIVEDTKKGIRDLLISTADVKFPASTVNAKIESKHNIFLNVDYPIKATTYSEGCVIQNNLFLLSKKALDMDLGKAETDPIIRNNLFIDNIVDIVFPSSQHPSYPYNQIVENNLLNSDSYNTNFGVGNIFNKTPLFVNREAGIYTLWHKEEGYAVNSPAVKAGNDGKDMGPWDISYSISTLEWSECLFEEGSYNLGISLIPINNEEILPHSGNLRTSIDTSRKVFEITLENKSNTRDFLKVQNLIEDTSVKKLYLYPYDGTQVEEVIQKTADVLFDGDCNALISIDSYTLKIGTLNSGYCRISISGTWYYYKIVNQTTMDNTVILECENIFGYSSLSEGTYTIEMKNCQFWGNAQLDNSNETKLNIENLTYPFIENQWRNFLFRLIDGTNDKQFRIDSNDGNSLTFTDVYDTAQSFTTSTDYSIMIDCVLTRQSIEAIKSSRNLEPFDGLRNGAELYVSGKTMEDARLMNNWKNYTLRLQEVSDVE